MRGRSGAGPAGGPPRGRGRDRGGGRGTSSRSYEGRDTGRSIPPHLRTNSAPARETWQNPMPPPPPPPPRPRSPVPRDDPLIQHSPREPIRFTIPDEDEAIPYGLGECGFESLQVLSTGQIGAEEIKWLDLETAVCEDDKRSVVGIAPIYYDDGKGLLGLAIATATKCLYCDFASWRVLRDEARRSCDVLEAMVFTSPKVLCVAFEFALVATSVRHYLRDITGVDVSSLRIGDDARSPSSTVHSIFGREKLINLATLWQFNSRKGGETDHGALNGALRAWLARTCAVHESRWDLVRTAPELDTRRIGIEQIVFFSEAHYVNTRIEALKPRFFKADFETARVDSKGVVEIRNSKFSTKLRQDSQQTLRITSSDGTVVKHAVAVTARGKSTTIQSRAGGPQDVASIEVVGRASGTLADEGWKAYLTGSLNGSINVYASKLNTRILWFTPAQQKRARQARLLYKAEKEHAEDPLPFSSAADRLNPSQREAHDAITAPIEKKDDYGSVLVITGPPGTGKTSVISASVRTWLLRNSEPDSGCIYCCTASNDAAKNIAESLIRSGFDDFRLIVSADFLIDWHEHRYDMGKNLVVSSMLKPSLKEQERDELMGGVRVILCTLAMLSSSNLQVNGFFKAFKMRTLLVDEASQIRIDQYPHVLHRFKSSLERIAFFGDARQLAPYNFGQIPEIKSVFDKSHLDSYFLNTQYRMPKAMGDFISHNVYDRRLKSADHMSDDPNCIRFIDVSSGSEEMSGTSTKNEREVLVVVELVRIYYRDTKFKILTPYDAQRNEIEAKLKAAGLPWEDRCFNVDSFQGQEEEIIIVSIVKTYKLGFLTELRRSNVMLTRLKKAIIVVTNQQFLQTVARNTLLGRLAQATKGSSPWIPESDLLSGKVNLPEEGTRAAPRSNATSSSINTGWPDDPSIPSTPPAEGETEDEPSDVVKSWLDDWGVTWDSVPATAPAAAVAAAAASHSSTVKSSSSKSDGNRATEWEAQTAGAIETSL